MPDGNGLGGLHLTLTHYFVEVSDYEVPASRSEGAHDCHSGVAKLIISSSSLGRGCRLELYLFVALLALLPKASNIIILAVISLVAGSGRHSLAIELNLLIQLALFVEGVHW